MSGMGAEGEAPSTTTRFPIHRRRSLDNAGAALSGGLGKNLNLIRTCRADRQIHRPLAQIGSASVRMYRGLGCIAFADILVVRRTCKHAVVQCALEREDIRLLQIEAGGVGSRCEAER